MTDKVDHSTGLIRMAGLGESVDSRSTPLCVIRGTDNAKIAKAETLVREAFIMAPEDTNIEIPPIVRERATP